MMMLLFRFIMFKFIIIIISFFIGLIKLNLIKLKRKRKYKKKKRKKRDKFISLNQFHQHKLLFLYGYSFFFIINFLFIFFFIYKLFSFYLSISVSFSFSWQFISNRIACNILTSETNITIYKCVVSFVVVVTQFSSLLYDAKYIYAIYKYKFWIFEKEIIYNKYEISNNNNKKIHEFSLITFIYLYKYIICMHVWI
jgi:hypothetical protein